MRLSFIQVSSSRLGASAKCPACGTGALLSFNWELARTSEQPRRDVSAFVHPRQLRYGVLYECVACSQPWYLCGEPQVMNAVAPERLSLIDRWFQRWQTRA